MIIYRGHVYRPVTAAVVNPDALADAIADFIFVYHKNAFNVDTVQRLNAKKISQTLLSELTTLENAALYFAENYPGMEHLTGEEIENQLNAGLDADVRAKLVAQYTGPQGVSDDIKNRLAVLIADWLSGQPYESEVVEHIPEGEFITENELTLEERIKAAAYLSQPDVMKTKMIEHFGSLDKALADFTETDDFIAPRQQQEPLIRKLDVKTMEALLPYISEEVEKRYFETFSTLEYHTRPWNANL